MKQIINSKYLSTIIFFLSIVVFIKLLWIIISILFLPTTGEDVRKSTEAKKLYVRVRLNNKSEIIPPVDTSIKVKTTASMKGYKLLGLYSSNEKLVVTISKSSKTEILAKGEKTNGFELMSAGKDFVTFKKNAKEFKLALESAKNNKQIRPSSKSSSTSTTKTSSSQSDIKEVDGIKQIPKTLLSSYTKDPDKIWKDVGLSPYKENGKTNGFKVNFVKKGSDIAKLGLQRGDILQAVNAEPLDLSSAMSIFNEIGSLENLTLTVLRNGTSKDLEYEIQ